MNQIHRHLRSLCEIAFDIAESMSLPLSVVATDLGGHPVVVLRGDRTSFASLEAARRKAVAAFTMHMSTAALTDMFAKDELVQRAVHASGDMLIVPGGFPVMFGEGCVGGLGLAGGHYSEDHIVGERAFTQLIERTEKKAKS
jgi:uncharacterized protein GlcG (DUF336 family)